MLTSVAYVVTDAPARYAKQLASHLGRKVPVENLPGEARRLVFGSGEGVLTPQPDRLVMQATAADADTLARIQDVLGRHLERFGERNSLTVIWEAV